MAVRAKLEFKILTVRAYEEEFDDLVFPELPG